MTCLLAAFALSSQAQQQSDTNDNYFPSNDPFTDELDDGFDAVEAQLEATFIQTDLQLEARYNAVHKAIQAAYTKQTKKIEVQWPDDVKVPSGAVWVAYSDDYNERIVYDFEQGYYQLEVSEQGDVAENLHRLAAMADKLSTDRVSTLQAMDNFGRAIVAEVESLGPSKPQTASLKPISKTKLEASSKITPQLARVAPNSDTTMRKALLKPANYKIISSVSAPSPKLNVQKLLDRIAVEESQSSGSEKAKEHNDQKALSKIPLTSSTISSVEASESMPLQIVQKQNSWQLRIPFVNSFQQTLIDQRMQTISEMSQRFNVDISIILAIIEAESSFNPMATSHIPAFGLMQLVPKTAGVDAYNHVYGQPKILSPEYLYDVENNIELGTAYIDVLQSRYLRGIENDDNKLYSMIASYNTGVGNLANTVSGSKRIRSAIRKINDMQPAYYLDFLQKNLPAEETKNYLHKVMTKRKKYQHLDEQ